MSKLSGVACLWCRYGVGLKAFHPASSARLDQLNEVVQGERDAARAQAAANAQITENTDTDADATVGEEAAGEMQPNRQEGEDAA